ncbi:NtaA/DmoA family FMN-dependent monooxygenase [Curtobacterium sp. MCBD17_035]|uniref:NtaA/DmoA family FMN-dependent monooxygenase n=1 Tax=Curtobacterium sp. MCBD17_035 TaxID=2175673 RepID=UPI0015E8CC30|nr:NtaA/DmoA family FMN-dependent monooxygenase [Curtobacterium sp. MCBD17_035]WIB66799.1 NtaA/DmoA family FMN-dependent monooxygenase [Curtobacterium sp. MCBD17_035]
MTKELFLGAFEINGVNLTSQGLWAHPDNTTWRYKELEHWTDLARMLDDGGFDFMFLADSYGYPVIDGVVPDVAFEQGVEIPKNDPMLLVPAMAAAAPRLCFGVTSSTSFEPPFANARRFATLDHLTRGRIAWNVVTTSSAVVTELFGKDRYVPHDERYAIAQEYLELSYALLEGSWEDDAVLADKGARRYADASKVHKVVHHGRYFDVEGYANTEPGPQRTPVLFQAGASSSGRAFAAGNAELVFLQGKDAPSLAAQVTDIRTRAEQAGRAGTDIRTVSGLSVITAPSTAQAEDQLEEYLSYVDPDAARVYYASMTGIDLAALDPEGSFSDVTTEGGRTQVERYKGTSVREATADFIRNGMREFVLTGTPTEVVDRIEALVTDTDLDGFNYTPYVTPGSYRSFIADVVPELRRRGMLPETPRTGTFRERLSGRGPHLPASHRAARFRHQPTTA